MNLKGKGTHDTIMIGTIMNKQKELIMRLSDAFGPSGMEDEVVAIAKEELSDFHVKEDRMRNLYIEPQDKQNGVNILLDAHMDEVGFIIQAICSIRLSWHKGYVETKGSIFCFISE